MLGTRIGSKSRETIRKLSEHLAPFPVFERPKEEQLWLKWQHISTHNGLQLDETILSHTYYQFDNLSQFQSNTHYSTLTNEYNL